MNRLTDHRYAEAIATGLTWLPPGIAWRVRHADFLTGIDPQWVGLHSIRGTLDGRSYGETAHCSYPWHSADRSTTVVLPVIGDANPVTVIHELGHVLDGELGFGHRAVPVNEYAATSREEAFACSLVASLFWYGDQDVLMQDKATLSLFAALS